MFLANVNMKCDNCKNPIIMHDYSSSLGQKNKTHWYLIRNDDDYRQNLYFEHYKQRILNDNSVAFSLLNDYTSIGLNNDKMMELRQFAGSLNCSL